MQLTKNFHLNEFIKSNTAIANGISNYPTAEHLTNLALLCENILQPLRDHIGKPLRITSGYRSQELNSILRGASKTSDHCHGKAGDLELWLEGKERNEIIFNAIRSLDLPFKQLIWEFGDDDCPNWVHVAFDKDNIKKEVLKAVKLDGRTQYLLMS